MFTTYRSRTTARIRSLPTATRRVYCSRLTWITELVRMKVAA